MITSYWLTGKWMFEGWAFFIELFMAELVFLITQKKRKRFILCLLSSFLILSLEYFFIPPFIEMVTPSISREGLYIYETFYFLFVFLTSVFILWISFEGDFWTILFCCVSGYCVQHISVLIYEIFRVAFNLKGFYTNPFFSVSFQGLLDFGMYFLFAKRIKKGDCVNVGNKNMILICLLSFLVNIGLSIWQSLADRDALTIVIEEVYSIICCCLLLFLLLNIFQKYSLQKEVDVLQYMWASDKEHYELQKDSVDMINIKCHDLKHTIDGLKGELSPNAVKELEKTLQSYDIVMKTGNDALDVILTEKNIICEKNHIQLTCMANGSALGFMDKVDVYSLFGNALDNAIRAILDMNNPEKSIISLVIKEEKEILSIDIENYFSGMLTYEKGFPVTTKEDKDNHGYGMRSMEQIVSKYGGYMTFSSENDLFCLDIAFPLSA